MKALALALTCCGGALFGQLLANGNQDNESAISCDVEERLESDRADTRWDAGGEYLDRLDSLDREVLNRID